MSVVITASDPKWDKFLQNFPRKDIYFTADYHRSFETTASRTAQAFCYEDSGKHFFFPVMLGDAGNGYFDIETVYGYTGPLANTSDSGFLAAAWAAYKTWAKEKKILCQLVRFNPLVESHEFYDSETIHDRDTVLVDVTGKWRNNYHQKLRGDISRANKLGLEFVRLDSAAQFKDLYIADMQRMNAGEFYFFKTEHFEYLQNSQSVKIYGIKNEGRLIAAASFMYYGENVHYHLSASDPESELKGYAVKFLLDNVIALAHEGGFKHLHLGGGRTNKPDDSLFFFKKRFGGKMLEYRLAKTILLPDEYEGLRVRWESLHGQPPPQNYLQFYRIKQ